VLSFTCIKTKNVAEVFFVSFLNLMLELLFPSQLLHHALLTLMLFYFVKFLLFNSLHDMKHCLFIGKETVYSELKVQASASTGTGVCVHCTDGFIVEQDSRVRTAILSHFVTPFVDNFVCSVFL